MSADPKISGAVLHQEICFQKMLSKYSLNYPRGLLLPVDVVPLRSEDDR